MDPVEMVIAEQVVASTLEPMKRAIALIVDQLRDMELRLRELEEIGKGR